MLYGLTVSKERGNVNENQAWGSMGLRASNLP